MDIELAQMNLPFSELTDSEFLATLQWAGRQHRKQSRISQSGDVDRFSQQLKHDLSSASRLARQHAKKRPASQQLMSAWNASGFDASERCGRLVDIAERLTALTLDSKAKKSSSNKKSNGKKTSKKFSELSSQLQLWLDECFSPADGTPIEWLVLFETLLLNNSRLSDDLRFRLWRVLYTVGSHLQSEFDGTQTSSHPDRQLIVDGEIPWLAGRLFGSIGDFKPAAQAGRKWLAQQIDAKTDTDGTPSAEILERLALWIAPFVRCQVWAQCFQTSLWNDKQQERFAQLAEVTASICRPDRRLALSNGFADDVSPLLKLALNQNESGSKSKSARYLSSISRQSSKPKKSVSTMGKRKIKKQDRPAVQSDWSQLACLRNAWSDQPDAAVVAHHGVFPLLELIALGTTVFSGEWSASIALDGKKVKWHDDWNCVCWNSDADVDYLELQCAPAEGCLFTRQVMLSRTDHFAVIADIVKANEGVRVDYESVLPVHPQWKTKSDNETRARSLKWKKQNVRILPLFLPESNIDSVAGECNFQDSKLVSKRSALGGIYAPLFVEWSPVRQRSFFDWRSLTVSELGNAVHPSEGAGYRCRLGNRQWLLYRNLGTSEEYRTVLGHHTNCETVIGQFDADGVVNPLIVVGE